MVYESDFYTTRRPYRPTPSLSTYTVTTEPSRQVRLLPGLGKVHVVHSYDRIIPYVGHKRLTIVSPAPVVVRLRPSTLYREFDRIEHKLRPYTYHSYTNDYLNSDSHVRIVYVRKPISGGYPVYRSSSLLTSRYYDPYFPSSWYYPSYYSSYYPTFYSYYAYPWATRFYSSYWPSRRIYSSCSFYPSERWYDLALYPSWRYNHYARAFDDETRLIRAQTASLLNQVHAHVPRKLQSLPTPYVTRFETPASWYNDSTYVHRMLIRSDGHGPEYTTYWTDPVKKSFHQGRFACMSIVDGRLHPRRRNLYIYYDDPVRNDIQLLSYYINRFRKEKDPNAPAIKVPRPLEAPEESEDVKQMKVARAARMAKLVAPKDEEPSIAQARREVEEKARKHAVEAAAAAMKGAEEAKRSVEARRQEEIDRQKAAAAKRAAEAGGTKRKEEEEKEAQRKVRQQQEEMEAAMRKAQVEEEARRAAEEQAEAARQEREAQEAAERAAELERIAEQARQEELAKQAEIAKAKRDEEERRRLEEAKRQAEAARAEEERLQLERLAEIARQAEEEKEAELARQAEELAELARQEAELAEEAKRQEEAAELERQEAEAAALRQKEAELAELAEAAEQARIAAEEALAEVEPEPEDQDVLEEADGAEEVTAEDDAAGSRVEPTSPVAEDAPADHVLSGEEDDEE